MNALLLALALVGGPPAANGLATVPGATNPAITQANMGQTICNPHWSTKSIRPPTSYTNKLKFQLMDEASIPHSDSSKYELDHDISLEIGGDPRSPQNLWLQPWDGPLGAHTKDVYENFLHREVCAGRMTLQQAQQQISSDWVEGYCAALSRGIVSSHPGASTACNARGASPGASASPSSRTPNAALSGGNRSTAYGLPSKHTSGAH